MIILRLWLARGRPKVLRLVPKSKGAILRALFLVAIVAAVLWLRFAKF
jgi:hypothetical protein